MVDCHEEWHRVSFGNCPELQKRVISVFSELYNSFHFSKKTKVIQNGRPPLTEKQTSQPQNTENLETEVKKSGD